VRQVRPILPLSRTNVRTPWKQPRNNWNTISTHPESAGRSRPGQVTTSSRQKRFSVNAIRMLAPVENIILDGELESGYVADKKSTHLLARKQGEVVARLTSTERTFVVTLRRHFRRGFFVYGPTQSFRGKPAGSRCASGFCFPRKKAISSAVYNRQHRVASHRRRAERTLQVLGSGHCWHRNLQVRNDWLTH